MSGPTLCWVTLEFKAYGKAKQFLAVDQAIKTTQFIRNKCIAWWQKCSDMNSKVFLCETIAINPAYTSQTCSSCGLIVKKSLSTRTHLCKCGLVLSRDHNAAINILNKRLLI